MTNYLEMLFPPPLKKKKQTHLEAPSRALHVKLLLDECLVYVILFSVQFLLIVWMETNTTSYLFHYFLPFLLESIKKYG